MILNIEKINYFIDILLDKDDFDHVSKNNLINIKKIINSINLHDKVINIKKLKKIVNDSEPIIYEMKKNYIDFSSSKTNKIKFVKSVRVNYDKIRKELFGFPTFDETYDSEIKNKISNCKNKYIYELEIDNNYFSKKIKINLFFYCSNIKNEKGLDIKLAQLIYTFIKTFSRNLELYDGFNIRFLLIDFPRVLKKDLKHASLTGEFNNSSGVTIFSDKELVITRKSGIIGLLIHELLHTLGLDFCYSFKDNTHANIIGWKSIWFNSCNINKNNNIKSFIESICNTNSSYFLAIYTAIYLSSKNKNKSDKILKYFKYLFVIELFHSYIQTVQVLKSFNISSYDDFFLNTTNRFYKQDALLFEYIILRFFLLSNYYKLLLKKMLQVNFNQYTDYNMNLEFQKELNNQTHKLIKKNNLKIIFNQILANINDLSEPNYFIEYFAINFV